MVLYRPTVFDGGDGGEGCYCKKFYTGEGEKLLRVSSASFVQSQKSRAKEIQFVSYELLFKFFGALLTGCENLTLS